MRNSITKRKASLTALSLREACWPILPKCPAEEEIRELLRHADERAVSLLTERRSVMDGLAVVLLERESLEGAELRRALEDAGATEEAATVGSAAGD